MIFKAPESMELGLHLITRAAQSAHLELKLIAKSQNIDHEVQEQQKGMMSILSAHMGLSYFMHKHLPSSLDSNTMHLCASVITTTPSGCPC